MRHFRTILILLIINPSTLLAQDYDRWDPPIDSTNILEKDTTFAGETFNYVKYNPDSGHITFGNVDLRKEPTKDGNWLFMNDKNEVIGTGSFKKGKKHGEWTVYDAGLKLMKYRRGKLVSGKSYSW